MSEKLYSAKCRVPGHGTWCEVAQDQIPAKRGCGEALNRIRRRRDKKIISGEIEEYYEEVEYDNVVLGRLEGALMSQHPEEIPHCPIPEESAKSKCILNNCVLCWAFYFLFGEIPTPEDIKNMEQIKQEKKGEEYYE